MGRENPPMYYLLLQNWVEHAVIADDLDACLGRERKGPRALGSCEH